MSRKDLTDEIKKAILLVTEQERPMAKQPITNEQLAALTNYQASLDWVVEYMDPQCWTLGNLRKESAEFKGNARDCWVSLDGEEPDGTFDGESQETWLFYAEVIDYCITVRKDYKKLTEQQFDLICQEKT